MIKLLRYISKVNFKFLMGFGCAYHNPALFSMLDAMSNGKESNCGSDTLT